MNFYTYTWLREDGSPYYVGKGVGDRAFISKGHVVSRPKSRSQIIVQHHESEQDAFAAEKFLIEFYGRKIDGTGCLVNIIAGGEGPTSEDLRRMWKSDTGQEAKKKQIVRMRKRHEEGRTCPTYGLQGRTYTRELGELKKVMAKTCAFEEKLQKLGINPQDTAAQMNSEPLRRWCEKNRLERFIPEALLHHWKMTVMEKELTD